MIAYHIAKIAKRLTALTFQTRQELEAYKKTHDIRKDTEIEILNEKKPRVKGMKEVRSKGGMVFQDFYHSYILSGKERDSYLQETKNWTLEARTIVSQLLMDWRPDPPPLMIRVIRDKDGVLLNMSAFEEVKDAVDMLYLVSNPTRKGNGTLAIAKFIKEKLPEGKAFELDSVRDAVGFYEKIGMKKEPGQWEGTTLTKFKFTYEEAQAFANRVYSTLGIKTASDRDWLKAIIQTEPKSGVFAARRK